MRRNVEMKIDTYQKTLGKHEATGSVVNVGVVPLRGLSTQSHLSFTERLVRPQPQILKVVLELTCGIVVDEAPVYHFEDVDNVLILRSDTYSCILEVDLREFTFSSIMKGKD